MPQRHPRHARAHGLVVTALGGRRDPAPDQAPEHLDPLDEVELDGADQPFAVYDPALAVHRVDLTDPRTDLQIEHEDAPRLVPDLLDAVLDAVPVGVVVRRPDGRDVAVNRTARTLLDDGTGTVLASVPIRPYGADVHAVVTTLQPPAAGRAARVARPAAQAPGPAAEAERLLRATVRHSPLATATLDPQGRMVDANPALCHLLDRDAAQLVGHELAAFARPDPCDPSDPPPADLLAGLRDGADVVEALTRYVRPAADTVWVRLTAIAVRDDDGRLVQVVAQLADVTEQQLAVQMLAHQNRHDALTGLPNRTLGLDTLQTELDRRGGVAVLCVDLDRFKAVNDSIGPARGDEVLGEVARRLQRAVRPGDTVARLAGDEFVVVCAGLEPGREAEQLAGLAERLLAEVREPVAVEGRVVVPSVSIGAAVSSPDDLPLGLLRDAGAALRQAKANGPGSWVLTDDSMRRRTLDELGIEDALRTGVAQGELRLHLQPIVDLVTEEVVGREALVRWQHPERGLLAPAGFLPVAEESGLIQDLGRWVLEEAARIAAAAPDLGYVAVNVSPAQVRRASLLPDVRHTLDVTGLEPTRLVLELTESMMLGAATDGRRQLRELDAIGVRTVVDDFGTGFAALSHLRELPVSGIKVDRTFTAGLGTDPQCDRIVEALTGLARGLGVDLVAEGVETETQRAVLAGIGCAHAQGFLFGRPEPVPA